MTKFRANYGAVFISVNASNVNVWSYYCVFFWGRLLLLWSSLCQNWKITCLGWSIGSMERSINSWYLRFLMAYFCRLLPSQNWKWRVSGWDCSWVYSRNTFTMSPTARSTDSLSSNPGFGNQYSNQFHWLQDSQICLMWCGVQQAKPGSDH